MLCIREGAEKFGRDRFDFTALVLNNKHHVGFPALDCSPSTTCHPCNPEEPYPEIHLLQSKHRPSLCDQEVGALN
jgi:hypothetical protein